MLDAELAALLWLLVETGTPVVVTGRAGSGRALVADALTGALPTGATVFEVAPDDDFAWLADADTLGWRTDRSREATPPGGGDRGVFLVRGLAEPDSGGLDGDRTRLVIRALSLGYGMLATAPGDGLDDLVERLHAPTIGTDEDERSRLGVVLVMAPPTGGRGARVAAAHYVRPVALDTHGHVQRLPPAVLATWNEQADRWDHFAWGVLDDLAGRTGRSPRDIEREQARRAALLAR